MGDFYMDAVEWLLERRSVQAFFWVAGRAARRIDKLMGEKS